MGQNCDWIRMLLPHLQESESSTFVVDQSPHLDPMNTDEWLPTIFLAFEFDKNNQMNQMNPDKE